LTLGKITKIVATRCQIFKLKGTKFNFGFGSGPDPAGGAYSAPPDLLAGLRGPTSKGWEEEGWEGEGKGGDGEGDEEGTRPHPFTPPLFLDTPLSHLCRKHYYMLGYVHSSTSMHIARLR